MTLTFNGGSYECKIFKAGEEFNRGNLPKLFNSITSVKAIMPGNGIGYIQVTIEPNYQDGIEILKSGLLGTGLSSTGQKPEKRGEGAGKQIKVSVDLTSKVSQSATGKSGSITRTPGQKSIMPYLMVRFRYPPGVTDRDGSEAITPWFTGAVGEPDLSFTAQDISMTMNAMHTSRFLESFKGSIQFSDIPAIDVIRNLTKSIGLEPTFDVGDTDTKELLNKPISVVANESRMDSIRNILFKKDCFYITIGGDDDKQQKDQLRIKRRTKIVNSEPTHTFVLWRQINPANNVIPIYDFQLNSSGMLFLRGAAFGSFQRGIDSSSKKSIQLEVTESDIEGPAITGSDTGAGTLPTGTKEQGGVTGIIDDSDKELTGESIPYLQRGKKHSNESEIVNTTLKAAHSGMKVNLVVPGLPSIKPLTLVQVIIGANVPGISAVYKVQKVTHIVDSNGWTTELELLQDAGATETARQKKKLAELDRAAVSKARFPSNIG